MFDVWKNVLEDLKQQLSPEKFSMYLSKTSLESIDDGKVIIGVSNIFMKVNVCKYFNTQIIESLRKNHIEVKSTEYIVTNSGTKVKKKPREVTEEKIKTPIKKQYITLKNEKHHNGLVLDYRFDNFIVGTNNDLAFSVAKAVVESPGKKYNPFFLYGKSGLGKTHLVQAIGNEIATQNPNLKILYTPVNHFYSDFIDAITNKKPDNFKKKYANLDVLIIDDFQFIVGKEKSQEEFFNLFNDMHLANKQIIVTSDRLPSEIKTLDPRLASRLTQTGYYDIQFPSFEDRCAILKAKADFNGVEIEQEAIEYISENVKTNIRDLNAEYDKLLAFADLRGITPLEVIKSGFGSPAISGGASRKESTPKKVIDKTARFYELETKVMLSKSRVSHIKNARQVAMYLMQTELGLSTPKIARELDMKDHTTILNGLSRINEKLKMDFKLREDINSLREKIYE